MGEFAFSSCTSLSNVTLSNKLTSISQGAFYKCNLSSVEIPQSVTSIGLNAFAKNTNLSSVTIPPNVTVLEGIAEYGGAFDGCTSLESVKFEGTTTIPVLKENAFRNCKFFTDNDESTGITLPSCEYLSAYLNTSGWDTYKDYILTKHNTGDWSSDETNHWHECSVCNNETDKEKHTWNSGVKDDTTGDVTYTCSVCQATKTDKHIHTFSSDWSKDDNYHWHAAICGHKSEVSDKAAHNWGTGVTDSTTGNVTFTCSVCQSTKTDTHMHTFAADWTTDDDYHWHAATCEHTSEINGKAAHTEDNGTVTLQPTETTVGEKTFKCSVCGYIMRIEAIPATGMEHIHDFGSDWKYDNTNHWHKCDCGEKTDLTAHIEDSGIVTVQPTETTTGIKTYYCTVCKYEMRTETVPATGTEHVHDFGTDWKYDNTNHWHECSCGEKSDLADHSENGGVVTLAPTGTTNGEMTYRCTVCGTITRTETIPATGVIPVPTPTPAPPSPPVTYPDSIVIPVITTDNDEPFIVDNRDIEGWESISEDIHITADGGIVDIDMNGTDILPKNIVEDIAGRDIDLILEMDGGITWTINGLTVTNAQRTNMKVYMNRSRIPADVLGTVSEGVYVKELTLKHTGEFGFTPVLTVKLPDKFDDKYANLFYYNSKSNEMEFVNFGAIKDGATKLAFSHASEYAVIVSDTPLGGEDISVAAGIFSDSDMLGKSKTTYPICVTVVLITAGISAVIFVRRKQK